MELTGKLSTISAALRLTAKVYPNGIPPYIADRAADDIDEFVEQNPSVADMPFRFDYP